jgi:hypothetical protein
MKLEFKNDTGLKLRADNPDESLNHYFKGRILDAYNEETRNFLEEVAVALRKLPPGKTVTVYSKPISVQLTRPEEARAEEKP